MSEEKEIDVFYLLGKILLAIRKGKFFIILCTLIFLIPGFYNYYISRNDYTISFVAGTPIIKVNELLLEVINGLRKDIETENRSSLEKKIGIKPVESSKIMSISIDSLQNSNFVKISITSNDSTSLLYFKQKTINFINNLKFIKNLQFEYLTTNQKLLQELEIKVYQLDSLQKMILNPNSFNNKILTVSPYYKEYVEILEKKLKIEANLNGIKDGGIINEFTCNVEKVNNKLTVDLLKYGFFGFIISILLLLLRVFLRKLNTYAK